MKELSIEEKAKYYDKAIEKARIWKNNSGMPKNKQGILDDIFPELKKSEDEKIRKDIIWCFKHSGIKENNPINPHVTTTVKDAIAWLEKQGKQKPSDKVEAHENMYNLKPI